MVRVRTSPGTQGPSDTEHLVAIGRRLRELRTRRDLSLSALARHAGVGKGSLSELEAGARNPTLGTLYALAGALEVPLSALLGEAPGLETSDEVLSAHLLAGRHHRDGGTTEV